MIIAVTNRKGGVAKTVSTLSTAAALAGLGQRVLCVDLDASGDLTESAGIELSDGDKTSYEVISEGIDPWTAIRHMRQKPTGPNYDVLPGDSALQNLPYVLHELDRPQIRLRDALRKVSDQYDFIIIDTPPTLGPATIQAMTASDYILIPARADYPSLNAAGAILSTLTDVRADLNPALKVLGTVLTEFSPRTRQTTEVLESWPSSIPVIAKISKSVGIPEATAAGVDIYEYAQMNRERRAMKPLEQYRNLAKKIMEVLDATQQ